MLHSPERKKPCRWHRRPGRAGPRFSKGFAAGCIAHAFYRERGQVGKVAGYRTGVGLSCSNPYFLITS
jgi:hypothetical protein